MIAGSVHMRSTAVNINASTHGGVNASTHGGGGGGFLGSTHGGSGGFLGSTHGGGGGFLGSTHGGFLGASTHGGTGISPSKGLRSTLGLSKRGDPLANVFTLKSVGSVVPEKGLSGAYGKIASFGLVQHPYFTSGCYVLSSKSNNFAIVQVKSCTAHSEWFH